MAIAVGDRVRPKLTSATLGTISRLQPQPPKLGTVSRVSGGNVWATFADAGMTLGTAGVLAGALDQITSTSSVTRNALIDQVVVGLKASGAVYNDAFVGKVVDVYDVDGITKVLIRTELGLFYELPSTQISILQGR